MSLEYKTLKTPGDKSRDNGPPIILVDNYVIILLVQNDKKLKNKFYYWKLVIEADIKWHLNLDW